MTNRSVCAVFQREQFSLKYNIILNKVYYSVLNPGLCSVLLGATIAAMHYHNMTRCSTKWVSSYHTCSSRAAAS